MLFDLEWFPGPHVGYFLACFEVSFCFNDLGSETGFMGFEKQAFGIRCIAKNNFHRSWNSHDSRAHL